MAPKMRIRLQATCMLLVTCNLLFNKPYSPDRLGTGLEN